MEYEPRRPISGVPRIGSSWISSSFSVIGCVLGCYVAFHR